MLLQRLLVHLAQFGVEQCDESCVARGAGALLACLPFTQCRRVAGQVLAASGERGRVERVRGAVGAVRRVVTLREEAFDELDDEQNRATR